LPEVIGLGTIHLSPVPIRVGLISEAQFIHRLMKLGEAGSDHSRDKVDHNQASSPAATYPIYQWSPDSDFEGDREVLMVGQGEHPIDKMTEEITQEAEEKLARAAQLARDADKGKRHNCLQDDSGSSNDEPRDGAPSRRHQLKFNSRYPTG
jgi:hypothetical protein